MITKSARVQEHIVKEFKIDSIQNDYRTQHKINELIIDYQAGRRKPESDMAVSKDTFTHFVVDPDNYNMFKSLVYSKNQKVMQVIEGLIVSYLKEKGKL